MQALAVSCEELRARTGNPPLEGVIISIDDVIAHAYTIDDLIVNAGNVI